jgi:hypothetical protein
MYTKTEVDEVLSQVEQEFEKALNSIKKSESTEEEIETEEIQAQEELSKSEEIEEVEEEVETIDDLYSSMTKSEIEDHYNSIKRVLFSEAEETQEEVIEKSEEIEEVESMLKSENDELKSENEQLKKSVEEMSSLINRLFESTEKKAPSQKALTSADYIAKSEEVVEEGIDLSSLSKNEITSKLNKLNYAELSKSDREAINNYCLENGSVEKIKHLITE